MHRRREPAGAWLVCQTPVPPPNRFHAALDAPPGVGRFFMQAAGLWIKLLQPTVSYVISVSLRLWISDPGRVPIMLATIALRLWLIVLIATAAAIPVAAAMGKL